MSRVLTKTLLAPDIHELVIESPEVAAKASPGEFVVVMADERGERIPLTLADWDSALGSVTLVLMVVGTSTRKLAAVGEGGELYALVGPLGHPSPVEDYGTVILAAGGVGTAPVYPIARALKEKGNRVVTVQAARTKELLFWTDRLAAVSDEHIVTTDDGSSGRRGLVTEPLRELLEADGGKSVGCVYAIGPAVMMRACAETTRPFGVKTVVSLNSVMVDGTGMCGGCRVEVGGETRFTCVDGPEFDGHQVDWALLMSRQRAHAAEEECSLQKRVEEELAG